MERFSEINNALDVDSSILETTVEKFENTKKSIEKFKSDDLEKDYDYARGQLYSLISKGQESINVIMEIAQDSGNARSFEVVGQLLKIVADITDKLIDMQKKMRDMDENMSSAKNITNNNALFVGSTAELQKLIKDGILNNKED
tara:strand:- start:1535 stop:1966 length:432 start_codon:yes stop_codon:yes gene_type:complete